MIAALRYYDTFVKVVNGYLRSACFTLTGLRSAFWQVGNTKADSTPTAGFVGELRNS
jgi:hypothetical protein